MKEFRLLSTCAPTVMTEPFLHGFVDDYLPTWLYETLASSFIDPATHPAGERLARGKRRIVFRAPPLPTVLASTPCWEQAVASIAGEAFTRDGWQWLRQSAFLEAQPGLYREFFAARLQTDPTALQWQCEFASLDRGVHLPPHSDSTDKVLSCILYFAPPAWDPAWGGATEFYVPRDARQASNFGNAFLTAAEVRTASSCAFRPNRLVFLAKGHNSWHGIAPLATPDGVPRRSFNFSLVLPASVPIGVAQQQRQAEIARREAVIFGRV